LVVVEVVDHMMLMVALEVVVTVEVVVVDMVVLVVMPLVISWVQMVL
jgi:hypothetical protein